MPAIPSTADAADLAERFLGGLGDRWLHTMGVAAWWHGLGYAPALRRTGLHQVDGATYLVEHSYPDRLCALVAHHSQRRSKLRSAACSTR